MSRQHIEIRQSFNAPVETIFNILTDHVSFGNSTFGLKVIGKGSGFCY
jgi:hypothetical protein